MSPQVSIIGCGWLGFPVAKQLVQKGFKVIGTTTTQSKIPLLVSEHINGHLFDVNAHQYAGDLKTILHGSDCILLNFPPKRVNNIAVDYPKCFKQFLPFIKPHQKVIFVSSTSVYQNTNDWVDEQMTCQPTKRSGIAILETEHILKQELHERLCILRLAGLIGANRMPGMFLAGKKDLPNANAPVNLIHQDDAIGLIIKIIEKDAFGTIFNGCSDQHPLRKDFYIKAAESCQVPTPSFLADPNPQFKIVNNNKSKKELQYPYQHPDPMSINSLNGTSKARAIR